MPNPISIQADWIEEAPSNGLTPAWQNGIWQFFKIYDFQDTLTYQGALPSPAFNMDVSYTDTGTSSCGFKITADGVDTPYSIVPNAAPQTISVPSCATSLVIKVYAGTNEDTLTLAPTPVPKFFDGALVRQQTTHRIYRGIDSPIKCYVRNEVGRVDLSQATTIQAKVYRYGMTWPFATLDATGDADGLVQFTVPASLLRTSGLGYDYGLYVQPYNLMRFDVFADDQLVYTALMEIV